VYSDIDDRVARARGKLLADYQTKYRDDPKYLKPKDRARPNPMRLRYPTDK
jgi:hypothetical protein